MRCLEKFNVTTLVLLSLILNSCSDDDFKKYFLLNELRLLALTADTPEASPGDTVNITPFISDITGEGRDLTITATACLDPGILLGNNPTCEGQADKVTLADAVAVTGLSAPNYTGATNSIAVPIPANLLDARSAVDQNNGVAYIAVFTLKTPEGATLTGLKRIFVSTRTPKNSNPGLDDVLGDDASLAALPSAATVLKVAVTAGSEETYVDLTGNGSETLTESVQISWFVSDGDLSENRTGSSETTTWTPPTTAPDGRGVLVVAVVRDRRGGESVSVRTL